MIENREFPEFPSFYFLIISTYGFATLMVAGIVIAALVTGALAMFVMKLLRI